MEEATEGTVSLYYALTLMRGTGLLRSAVEAAVLCRLLNRESGRKPGSESRRSLTLEMQGNALLVKTWCRRP